MKSKKTVSKSSPAPIVQEKKVHFGTLMDICHLQNAELEPKYQKYKGRVVLRGDIVKDDSDPYALLTEQGSSASQITAAKVMGVIARLPGCAGHHPNAVSAYTQVRMEDVPRMLKIPNQNVLLCGCVFHDTSGQTHGRILKIQQFILRFCLNACRPRS